MDEAWCIHCKTSVSLVHAIAEFPCPSCSSKEYFYIVSGRDLDIEICDAEANRMMRIGQWEAASAAYTRCFSAGNMSAAERNLREVTLEWRKACASRAVALIADGGVPLDLFRSKLVDEYDEFAVAWVLQEFRGIRLVPSEGAFIVEVR